jgi:hypothetical protein
MKSKPTAARFRLRIARAFAAIALVSTAVPAQDPDALMAAKLAGYVSCINEHSNWVLQSRDRYFSWLQIAAEGSDGTRRHRLRAL